MDNSLRFSNGAPTRLESLRCQRVESSRGWRVQTLPKEIICAHCGDQIDLPVHCCELSKLIYCKRCEMRKDENVCPLASEDHEHIYIVDAEWREK